ncbi:GNAT family N-acetyltransferase [Candidatus Hydrogenosomobacter endosymbioticus]|uniref:N-acetyltransferase domain-containing protein n=1 Tax=Candidatus Hydrogenosomobacter endosymbioticus TaxID=2558174 RepID=A0ABM7V823_9PROT|nr:GNAT family N-acetyltransferase [Candidatus Hydrogenosomobacter endosymbioticus]BDB95878.1 hypothetical protein HYD_0110 [Candidatus Hydrogenosomobacter endosymbioticus]
MCAEICFSQAESGCDASVITSGINEEAKALGVASSSEPFSFFVKDDGGAVIAGCNGYFVHGSAYTDQLWVAKEYRGNGLGRIVMNKVHKEGMERGCCIATTSTMSFRNVVGFYEKLGYVVDFIRDGYANGARCIFLLKKLA